MQKMINEIYLSTVAKDVLEFTNDQIQDLYAIASQCTLAGGQAVYRARSLYALADKNTFFNNFTVCEAAGYAMRKAVILYNEENRRFVRTGEQFSTGSCRAD